MRTSIASLISGAFMALLVCAPAHAERIKDLAQVAGVRGRAGEQGRGRDGEECRDGCTHVRGPQ